MSLQSAAQALNAHFDAAVQAEMLALLERLVNMDTFSADGTHVDSMGDVLAQWLCQEGLHTERCERQNLADDEPLLHGVGHILVGRTHPKKQGNGVVSLGHMDTVFPAGTAAARPFRIENGRAYGPGVVDMKAGLVASLFAIRALRRLDLVRTPLTVVLSPDEELGAPTATRAYRSLLPGSLAVLCAEPGLPGFGITTRRKGSGHLRLHISGKAAHAGVNYEDGASAILELAHKTLAFDKLVDLAAETTVNTGLVSGGSAPNCVADQAEARVHITFSTLDNGQRLVDALYALAHTPIIHGTRCTLTGGIRLYPLEESASNQSLFGLASEAAHALGLPIREDHVKGAAESGFISGMLGIPTLCGMGPEGFGYHTEAEFLDVDTLVPRCKLLALTAALCPAVATAR